MPERVYTPSEELYHDLCAVPGPWQLIREGMHEGYANDLYPAAKLRKIYAQVIVAHARDWLLSNRDASGSRVRLHAKALQWVVTMTTNIGDRSEAAGLTGSPLTYNTIRWDIAERLMHDYEFTQTVALDIAELLSACYYLYPSVLFMDTPFERSLMLTIGAEIWDEVRA